jgi:CubicO group peptidase (beta-lactamase class C family)
VLTLAAVGVALAALHFSYPLPYVYTVMVDQGPDFDDIHQFPARSIAASDAPQEMTVAVDTGVAEVLEQHPDVEQLGTLLDETETTAFLVVHDGRLVEERYLLGHDRNSFQNSFSIAKSFASALVGLALRDGVLKLDAPITRYLPELAERDAGFGKITVEHLLDMRSGIRYSRDVRFPFVNQYDPLVYYFPDLESVVLNRTEIDSPPGEFQYVNYNTPLLGLILRRTTGLSPAQYLQRDLWQLMGATGPAGWTTDDRGFERMESGFFATARDLARFGQLYLDRGRVGDRQVVPESWVLQSTDFTAPAEVEKYDGRAWGYRLGWWVVPRPDGPSDFCGIGHFGQFIYVSPQYGAVFVRNGPGRGDWGDRDWTELFYFAAERLEGD